MKIFGAGNDCRKILEGSSYRELVEWIADNDDSKVGQNICGIPIVSNDVICKMSASETIWVSSLKYFKEISESIRSLNPIVRIEYIGESIVARGRTQEEELAHSLQKSLASEKDVYLEYSADFCGDTDEFKKRYFNLIRNFDMESAQIINRTLKGLRCLYGCEPYKAQDIIDTEAVLAFDMRMTGIRKDIMKIGTAYAYGNCFLPKNYFMHKYFADKGGMDFVNDLEYIREGDVIDCGAYIGDSSLFYSKYTDRKVYAVEAQRDNCRHIQKTIELNGLSNVEILNMGVGREKGTAYIYHHENRNWGTLNPVASRDYQGTEEIEVDTIDSIVEKYQIVPSLIKADIEGSESDMLLGAKNTLAKYRPTLIICIYHTARDFFGIKPFLEELDLGYRFRIWKENPRSVLTGLVLIAESVR